MPVRRKNPSVRLKHRNPEAKLMHLASQFRQAMAAGNYHAARKFCEDVLALTPGNPSVLGDYALTLMRTGDYLKSWQVYSYMFQNKERHRYTGNWLDGLAEVCGWLGKQDELKFYGNYALCLADRQCADRKVWPLPASAPTRFQAANRRGNIIAYSLYGGSPRYCETMIKNAQLMDEFYPAWRCRVYHDDTVPGHVLERLKALDVELVDMSGVSGIEPTMWRFLVSDDPGVSRYLVRDADSLFSEKEAVAVQEWVNSPYYFHHMRDYFTHTELLLAGMWGGTAGVLPPLEPLMRQFIRSYKGNPRYTDQQFLRYILWPTVRTSILNHDEIFQFHHARDYPEHGVSRWQDHPFHIGSNASISSIGGTVALRDGERLFVDLISEEGTFRYSISAHDGQWSLPLPFFMIDDYQAGQLNVTVSAAV
ncbi:tetratricopeptide repeat protein [Jejubacter calystegiae]|uniref:Tetratricopeptide repeat protein n=1 Tax=Jejubacter calystegiae TaxID=2579935 RepID=A0A4P8YE50_9ENTR|nr:tetratricopeptide repeat protein [Jejubacter calystegiae]QCT18895.1 tetratricopeptide repeat protein [Jejubacter calystegiae]